MLIYRILHAGCDNPLFDELERRRLYLINLTSAMAGGLAIVFGIFLLWKDQIGINFIAAWLEFLIFMMVIRLNTRHQYISAALLVIGGHMVSLVFRPFLLSCCPDRCAHRLPDQFCD